MHGNDDQIALYKGSTLRVVKFLKCGTPKLYAGLLPGMFTIHAVVECFAMIAQASSARNDLAAHT
jgi:hypothetical protein